MRHFSCMTEGCTSTSKEADMRFFVFPRPKAICQLWTSFTGNTTLQDRWLNRETFPRHTYRICSKHFRDRDFTNCWKDRLNRGAVPSLNGPSASPRSHQLPEKAIILECFPQKNSSLALDHDYIKEEFPSDGNHINFQEQLDGSPQLSDKVIVHDSVPQKNSSLALDHDYIKEEFPSDEFNIEGSEDVPENDYECPSDEGFGITKPSEDKNVTMVLAGNSGEDSVNKVSNDSCFEDALSKKIPSSNTPEDERLCPSPVVSTKERREGFTIKRRTILLNRSHSSNKEDLVKEAQKQTLPGEPKECSNAKMRLWLKRIESHVSKSSISPAMPHDDLVQAENELNSVYIRVNEKSADILEKIPVSILKDITGLDASVFAEIKNIRKRLNVKQKLIKSYLKNKENEDDKNTYSTKKRTHSKDVEAQNKYLSSQASRRLNECGKVSKNQSLTTSSSSSSSFAHKAPINPSILRVRPQSSDKVNTLQNPLKSHSSLNRTEKDIVGANSVPINKGLLCDDTGNSSTGVEFVTTSRNANSWSSISKDLPVSSFESTMKNKFISGCETSVVDIVTNVPLIREISAAYVCDTPLSVKALPVNDNLSTFHPKGKKGNQTVGVDSCKSPNYISKEDEVEQSRVKRKCGDDEYKIKNRIKIKAPYKSSSDVG